MPPICATHRAPMSFVIDGTDERACYGCVREAIEAAISASKEPMTQSAGWFMHTRFHRNFRIAGCEYCIAETRL